MSDKIVLPFEGGTPLRKPNELPYPQSPLASRRAPDSPSTEQLLGMFAAAAGADIVTWEPRGLGLVAGLAIAESRYRVLDRVRT